MVSDPDPYPLRPELLPSWQECAGPYLARFARAAEELEGVLRLRFEVFCLELGEGHASSRGSGREEDEFDACSHHLIVADRRDGRVVGTYRMRTAELAARGPGLYSAREFDLRPLPAALLARSVELGRACVAPEHRNGVVLSLLLRGVASYLVYTGGRHLFGCASLPTLDPRAARCAEAELLRRELWHPELRVEALACCASPPLPDPSDAVETPKPAQDRRILPRLFQSYFSLGARVCGGPAFDRGFGTTDFFLLFDLSRIDRRAHRRYCA